MFSKQPTCRPAFLCVCHPERSRRISIPMCHTSLEIPRQARLQRFAQQCGQARDDTHRCVGCFAAPSIPPPASCDALFRWTITATITVDDSDLTLVVRNRRRNRPPSPASRIPPPASCILPLSSLSHSTTPVPSPKTPLATRLEFFCAKKQLLSRKTAIAEIERSLF